MTSSFTAQDRWLSDGGRYEFRTVAIPPGRPEADARRMLNDAAEYGRWELARSTLYFGGMRKVVLRRKAIDVRPTWRSGALDPN